MIPFGIASMCAQIYLLRWRKGMVYFDSGMSEIDYMGGVEGQMGGCRSPVLDIWEGSRAYRFNVLTAHLKQTRERVRWSRGHVHAVYHVLLFTAGQGQFVVAGRGESSHRGVLIVLPPGVPHDFAPYRGGHTYHELTFTFRGEEEGVLEWDPSRLLSYYAGAPLRWPGVQQLDDASFAALDGCFARVLNALRGATPEGLAACSRIGELFAMLVALCDEPARRDVEATGIVACARQIIEREYASASLTLAGLAQRVGVTPEHLCREFRREREASPMACRNALRMRNAMGLLEHTTLTCQEIADRVGYGDAYAFSKAFRREVGCSPTAYRRGRREAPDV